MNSCSHTHFGQKIVRKMDSLIEKLQSLKGATIDDEVIANLLLQAASSSKTPEPASKKISGFVDICRNDSDHVDDILVASRAAELEFESMKRYVPKPQQPRIVGIDGLRDEELSSDSDDELNHHKGAEESILDKLLSKNSLVAVNDDDEAVEASADVEQEELDLSHIPMSVVVPYGAQYVPLGKILSVVDGLLVIGESNPLEVDTQSPPKSSLVACDVESMVFLAGSNPLEVIGMIVDTMGTVHYPMHLVLVSNKALLTRLQESNQLLGAAVCTLTSHAKIVEIDSIGGHLAIRGSPQLAELEDCDDDGADEDESKPAADSQQRNHSSKPFSHRR